MRILKCPFSLCVCSACFSPVHDGIKFYPTSNKMYRGAPHMLTLTLIIIIIIDVPKYSNLICSFHSFIFIHSAISLPVFSYGHHHFKERKKSPKICTQHLPPSYILLWLSTLSENLPLSLSLSLSPMVPI